MQRFRESVTVECYRFSLRIHEAQTGYRVLISLLPEMPESVKRGVFKGAHEWCLSARQNLPMVTARPNRDGDEIEVEILGNESKGRMFEQLCQLPRELEIAGLHQLDEDVALAG